MAKTKVPTGLAVSRNGGTYTFSWKCGEKYKAQQLEYRFNWGGFASLGVSKGQTSAAVGAAGVSVVSFRVRGKKGSKWSAWSGEAAYGLAPPNAPAVSASLSSPDTTKFAYNVAADDTSPQHFSNATWQSVLIANCNTADGNAVNWSGAEQGTTGASYEWSKTESGFSATYYSYTRWFRVRANGWGGSTGWYYARHVYATPDKAKNVTATYSKLSGTGYAVSATWDSPASVAHPIDSITVQYLITEPEVTINETSDELTSTITCPNTESGWTSLSDVSGVGGKRAISFTVGADLADDKCIFLRVNNKHDSITTYGDPILVKEGIGKIKQPEIASVSPGGVERLYTVAVTRNTAINNAFIAVYLRTLAEPNPEMPIGIIPPKGSSSYTGDSVNCIIPELADGEVPSFGVKTFIANYSPTEPQSETEPTYYSITDIENVGNMQSDINWKSGSVPLPPSNVSLVKISDEVVQIGWNWSWREANQAEISWADHEDAWVSTAEPTVYTVNSTNAGKWNIAGLSIGTWYFRIRLIKTSENSVAYGTYCETKVIKLSSSPDTPAITISESVIPQDGSVTCYWAYVSTDGTAQMQAEVCEAFYSYVAVENPTGNPYDQGWYELKNEKYVRSFDTTVESGKTYYKTTGNITYSDPIASTATAQHITLNAKDHGWLSGETHHLAVRVTAASGEQSEGWSAPVPVNIAEPIQAKIVSHTFTKINIPVEDSEEVRTVMALRELPLSIRATGCGVGGMTTIILERATSYQMERPDGLDHDGFEGETIVIKAQNGDLSMTIEQSELLGVLDDGATYRVIAIARDTYGQTSQTSTLYTGDYNAVITPIGSPAENRYYEYDGSEYVLSEDTEVDSEKTYYLPESFDTFEVHWTHQAITPSANVEVRTDSHVTIITPIQPEGYGTGDVIDIYRLSADRPKLIVQGAEFGTAYVDPYPTLGDFGGHRIVYRTYNGDYITDEDIPAWTDYEASENAIYKHNVFAIIIDFDGEQLVLPYDVGVSNSWSKDYEETKYLGGSIQGDWGPVVGRSASLTTTIPVEYDSDAIEMLRRLADYPGICHVRTPDGSSYTANVDVKDNREEKWVNRKAKVTLEITRVDGEGFDGLTYSQWIDDGE